MAYEVLKLDRRFKGYNDFKYAIDPVWGPPSHMQVMYDRSFITLRTWCWATWGPSLEMYLSEYNNTHWVWDSENNRRRIYLRGDEELMLFRLKFVS